MAAIDAAFAEVKHLTPWVVRYRIMDNELYRYFVEGEPITLKDNSTEKAIKTLMQKTCFPDMDFLISYLDSFPFLPYPLNAPILVSAKLKNVPKNGILIPDSAIDRSLVDVRYQSGAQSPDPLVNEKAICHLARLVHQSDPWKAAPTLIRASRPARCA